MWKILNSPKSYIFYVLTTSWKWFLNKKSVCGHCNSEAGKIYYQLWLWWIRFYGSICTIIRRLRTHYTKAVFIPKRIMIRRVGPIIKFQRSRTRVVLLVGNGQKPTCQSFKRCSASQKLFAGAFHLTATIVFYCLPCTEVLKITVYKFKYPKTLINL